MEPENPVINGDQLPWQEDLPASGESTSAMTSPQLLYEPSSLFSPPACYYNQVPNDPAGDNDREIGPSVHEESSTATVLPVVPIPSLESLLPYLSMPIRNHLNEDSIDSSGIGSAVGSLTPPEALNGVTKHMESLGVTDDISSLTPNDRCESTHSTSSLLMEPPKMEPVQLKTKTKQKRGRGRPFGSCSKNKRSTATTDKASLTTETEEADNPAEQEAPWPAETVYDIEALVDRRKLKGVTQYLVKWKGWSSSANTWEPKDGLMEQCHGIIEYYDQLRAKASKRVTVTVKQYDAHVLSKSHVVLKIEKANAKSKLKQAVPAPVEALGKRVGKLEDDVKPLGSRILEEVPEGREPEKILGVALHEDDLLYLVQWKNDKFTKQKGEEYENGLTSNNTNVIYASVFKEKFPQLAIEMYQSKMVKVEEPSDQALTEEQETNEAEKAMELKRLRVEEEEKELANTCDRLKKARRSSYRPRARGDCELLNDEAAQAIAKEKKRKDRFDPDTSSSEESDGLDDEDGLDILMDETEEAMDLD